MRGKRTQTADGLEKQFQVMKGIEGEIRETEIDSMANLYL